MKQWFVITGGPSTGKTTLLAELTKHGLTTVPEAARLVIDEGLAAGHTLEQLRADEEAFQNKVFNRKIKIEQKLSEAANDIVVFLDRGLHDTIAYFKAYNYQINDVITKACKAHSYQKVFLLNQLDTFEEDYARTESAEFVAKLHDLLREAYESSGLEVIEVPVMPPKERADFVLQHIA